METNEQPNLENEEMKMPTQSPGNNSATPLEGHNGLIISLLVAGLAIILIGLYLWYHATLIPVQEPVAETSRPTAEMNNEPESTTAQAQTQSYTAVSSSDEMDAIEADLESTGFGSLEAEMAQIDSEFEASN
jgi:hypothetical protein